MGKEFIPLYNDKGQVSDPEIARAMAKHEQSGREFLEEGGPGEKERFIAKNVEEVGIEKHAEKMLKVVVDKIRATLSPEEIAVIKRLAYDRSTGQSNIREFFDLLTK